MYVLIRKRSFVSTSMEKRKDQSLSLTVNYKRVLNTMNTTGRTCGQEKTAWHGASWVVPFDRHISDKLKGNSDDRDGTHRQYRREEEEDIKVGSLSHDNVPPQIGSRKRITRRIHVRNFRACYVQCWPCIKWLSLVSPHQEISGRPETEVWSRHKTRSAELGEGFGGEHFRRRHTTVGTSIKRVL